MSDLIPVHLTWMRAAGRAERTVHARARLLRHANTHLPYGIDNADTTEWADYLANPVWSTWTRLTYDRHARGYYDWAVWNGYLTLNPLDGIPRPPEGDRLPHPASDEQLAAALELLPVMPWRWAVLLAAYGGLRACEITRLRREDCTVELMLVRGKGDRLDQVPMAPILWELIRPRLPGLLVVGARGRPLSAQMLSQMQGKVWARVGLTCTLHDFRHWCGTNVQRQTGNIRITQRVLRHRSVRSTEGYTLVSATELRSAVAALPLFTAPASR